MPPSDSFRSGLPGWLILMGALTAIGPFAIDMYLPAFPTIAANLGVPRGDVERTLAAYLIGLAMAQVFYGPMADRYGRKPPLLVGLALFMVASLGCALSGSVEALTGWLKPNVHARGSIPVDFQALMVEATGRRLDSGALLRRIEERYVPA